MKMSSAYDFCCIYIKKKLIMEANTIVCYIGLKSTIHKEKKKGMTVVMNSEEKS